MGFGCRYGSEYSSKEYRRHPRDSSHLKPKNLNYWGIVRPIDPRSNEFLEAVCKMRSLIDIKITNKNLVDINKIGLKVMNRGLVSSLLRETTLQREIESKDVKRWTASAIDSLNGSGSRTIRIEPEMFEPLLLRKRGAYIGSLAIRRSTELFCDLQKSNSHVRDYIAQRASSTSERSALSPRIDLFQVPLIMEEAGNQAIQEFHSILADGGAATLLKPVELYLAQAY